MLDIRVLFVLNVLNHSKDSQKLQHKCIYTESRYIKDISTVFNLRKSKPTKVKFGYISNDNAKHPNIFLLNEMQK